MMYGSTFCIIVLPFAMGLIIITISANKKNLGTSNFKESNGRHRGLASDLIHIRYKCGVSYKLD